MRRLSASFVVTAVSLSCSREPTTTPVHPDPTPNPPMPSIGNPPEPVIRKRKVTQVDKEWKQAKPFDWSKAKELNPKDGDNRTIYASNDSCFVRLPFPPGEKITSWRPQPTKIVSCPESMDDAAWDHCYGGDIRLVDQRCVCTVDGNPPPPPRDIPCPK
jgi:hypothetical protein